MVLISIISLVLFGFLGILTWASSDLPLVQREIAKNTRKEGQEGSDYKMIGLLAVLYKVLAVIVWVLGIVLAIAGPRTLPFFF